eukprot:Em0017g595a
MRRHRPWVRRNAFFLAASSSFALSVIVLAAVMAGRPYHCNGSPDAGVLPRMYMSMLLSEQSTHQDTPANAQDLHQDGESDIPCTDRFTDPLAQRLCTIEAATIFYTPAKHPVVVAKDISVVRYYASRDLQGWAIAYRNISFDFFEDLGAHPNFNVFLCMGIHTQDTNCLRVSAYRTLGQGQRFSPIPGLRNILWRKDAMCQTMKEVLSTYEGPTNFTFPCWVLPDDLHELNATMLREPSDWIVKPGNRGEGHGIFVVSSIDEITRSNLTMNGYVVQPLLKQPYLVFGRKIDLRTYVLITSVTPLRAYIYNEGLVRFASSDYDHNATRGGKEQQFLTNTSVGKKYVQLSNLTWTFERLYRHLVSQGTDAEKVFGSIHEAIVRLLLSSEYHFREVFHGALGGYTCQHCFQLLGIDVILDSNLNPIVIEVNGLPSMQLSQDPGVPPDLSNPYTATKFNLMLDMLQILFKGSSVAGSLADELNRLGVGLKPGPLCTPEHVHCVDMKEVRNLLDSKREFVNKGGFRRLYPSPSGLRYSKLIFHMHNVIRRKEVPDTLQRTLWRSHHLYTVLEKVYTKTLSL